MPKTPSRWVLKADNGLYATEEPKMWAMKLEKAHKFSSKRQALMAKKELEQGGCAVTVVETY